MIKPDITPLGDLPSWLTMVARLCPIIHVALVGAGNGTGQLVQWLLRHSDVAGEEAPAVTMLEPHLPSISQLAKRMAGFGHISKVATWQLLPDLLVSVQGTHAYHQYALATENCLLPPEELRPLWPGLKLHSQQLIKGVEMTTLLPANWLMVDCLPAADLLHGIPLYTKVVLARVVLANKAPAGSSLDDVLGLLAVSGFKVMAVFAERNSAIGKALLVRDLNCPAKEAEIIEPKYDLQSINFESFQENSNVVKKKINNLNCELAQLYTSQSNQFKFIDIKGLLSDEVDVRDSILEYLHLRMKLLFADENIPKLCMTKFSKYGKSFNFIHFFGDYIPTKILNSGDFYEGPFLNILKRLHNTNGLIVDCGANIGNHSIFFSSLMNSNVISYEPHPYNNFILNINSIINHSDRVVVVKDYALSDNHSDIYLHIPTQDNWGSVTADVKGGACSVNNNFKCKTIALDYDLEGFNEIISLIKIDVEGMELLVLRGAVNIIKKSYPIITVECFTRQVYQEIKTFLMEYGYFVIESANATPTFIFLSELNPQHLRLHRDYLEQLSFEKMLKNKNF